MAGTVMSGGVSSDTRPGTGHAALPSSVALNSTGASYSDGSVILSAPCCASYSDGSFCSEGIFPMCPGQQFQPGAAGMFKTCDPGLSSPER